MYGVSITVEITAAFRYLNRFVVIKSKAIRKSKKEKVWYISHTVTVKTSIRMNEGMVCTKKSYFDKTKTLQRCIHCYNEFYPGQCRLWIKKGFIRQSSFLFLSRLIICCSSVWNGKLILPSIVRERLNVVYPSLKCNKQFSLSTENVRPPIIFIYLPGERIDKIYYPVLYLQCLLKALSYFKYRHTSATNQPHLIHKWTIILYIQILQSSYIRI